jgi:hypothetical protein
MVVRNIVAQQELRRLIQYAPQQDQRRIPCTFIF